MPFDIMTFVERMMNALNDMDWGWWPFLRLRPAKSERFTRAAVVAYFAILIFGVLIVVVIIPVVIATVLRVMGGRAFALSLFLYAAAFRWCVGHGIFTAALASFAVTGIGAIVLSRWAWDRRARRLSTPAQPDVDPHVWPPPPQM